MTKNSEFQKELKEKIKPGVKASDLRKLKRSKSDSDLPNVPKSPPLQHSKSEPPLVQPSLAEQNIQLQEQVKFHAETASNYLQSLQTSQAKVSELEEKLKEKTTELDNSLLARYEAVKQFSKIYDKLRLIRKELDENADQASDEIINQDETITNLRTNQRKAQQKIRELEQDLNLAEKLAEMRKYPLPNPESDESYLKYIFGGLALVFLGLWLTKYQER